MEYHTWQKVIIAILAFLQGTSSIVMSIGSANGPAEMFGFVLGAYLGATVLMVVLASVVIYSTRKTRSLFGRVKTRVA